MKLTGITFITTYNCNANCEHCFFDTKGKQLYMNPEIIDLVYSDISITKNMFWNHLSGGEILLKESIVLDIIKKIKTYFSGNIGISSNGFWARTPQVAENVITKLVNTGVSGIAISSDKYHEPYISKEYTKNAIQAITNAGLKNHCYIMSAFPENKKINTSNGNSQIPYASIKIRSIGKGSKINIPKKEDIPQGKCIDLSECLGKKGPNNPSMVWIDPYGNVMICYGITIGNIFKTSFKEIIETYTPEKFQIIKTLTEQGPQALYSIAKDKGLINNHLFYDECDVCYTSRKALQNTFQEFTPTECYP